MKLAGLIKEGEPGEKVLSPALTMLPALLENASSLSNGGSGGGGGRERVVVVGESSRPHEAVGKKDSRAMAGFFAGGMIPVGAPAGFEERRAVVVSVAEAAGARLQLMKRKEKKTTTTSPISSPSSSSSSPLVPSCPCPELEALFFTAEGWVSGDYAAAVRGALESRRERRRREKEEEEAAATAATAATVENEERGDGKGKPASPPALPLRGPLTAEEIVRALLKGPRPPRASDLAAALEWARDAAAAVVAGDGGDESKNESVVGRSKRKAK